MNALKDVFIIVRGNEYNLNAAYFPTHLAASIPSGHPSEIDVHQELTATIRATLRAQPEANPHYGDHEVRGSHGAAYFAFAYPVRR
jgi:hypothetical protein